jgi:fibronectin-binding autotransporter adhesin
MQHGIKTRGRRAGRAMITAAAIASAGMAAKAWATPPTQYVWSGNGGSGYFSYSTNWISPPGVLPLSGNNEIVFGPRNDYGSAPFANGAYSVAGIYFNASAYPFTVEDNPIAIGSTGIEDDATNNEAILNNLTLTAPQTWLIGNLNGANLNLGGTQNLSGQALTLSGQFTNSALTANLIGSGSVMVNGSAWSLNLAGNSNFTGDFNISGGSVTFPSGSNLSASDFYVTAVATFNLAGATLSTTSSNGQVGIGSGSASQTTSALISSGTLNYRETDVGFNGPGLLTQKGGTQNGTYLNVGGTGTPAGTGTFNFSGGTINLNTLDIAYTAPGVVNQTGGTVNATAVVIGYYNVGATGAVYVNGSSASWNIGTGGIALGIVGNANPASLQVSGGAFVDTTGPLNLRSNGSSVNIAGGFVAVASLSGVNGSSVQLANSTTDSALNFPGNTAVTGVYNGSISGTGGVFLYGSSINEQLLGANTFTGPVTVRAGSLEMATGASTAYQTGGTTLTGTLILDFGNYGTSTLNAGTNGTIIYNTSSITGGILTGSGTHNVSSVTSFNGTNFASGSTVTLSSSGPTLTNTFVAGTVSASGGATVSILGTFNLSGGTFNANAADYLVVGTGSAATTTAVIASGTVDYYTCEIGLYGQGLLVQTGGTQAGTYLDVGVANSPSVFGTFNFSGGSVNQGGGGSVTVGYEGPGVLNQTGGTINSGSVRIGYYQSGFNGQASISGSTASWNLAGGGVLIGIPNDPTIGQLTASNGASIVTTGALNLLSAAASVNISSATLTAASLTGAAGSTITLADPIAGTALTINGAGSTYAGNIGGTGSLLYNGSGTQVLSGNNTFTGNVTVTSGTLNLASGTATTYQASGGTLILAFGNLGTSTVRADGTGTVLFSTFSLTGGVLAGSATFNASAVSSVTGTNFSSGTTVNLNTTATSQSGTLIAGTVNVGSGTTNVHGGFNLSGGTFNNSGGTFNVFPDTATSPAVIASGTLIYGTEAIGLNGPGSLIQTGGSQSGNHLEIGDIGLSNNFGTLNLSGGTVTVASVLDIGDGGPGVLNQSGGTINAGRITIGFNASGDSGQAAVGGSSASWNIGTGGIFAGKPGDPTVGQLAITGGAKVVATGAFVLESSAVSVNVSAATLTVTALNGASGATITLADPGTGPALTINGAGSTYAGNIGGTGSLLYNGSGTQVLSGNNTFTGTVTVASGTLEMANGKSPIYQVSGGSMILDPGGGFSATGGAVANVGSGVLTNNATFTGAINLYNGGALRGNGSASQINMTQVNTGFFPGGAGTLPAFNGSGYCIIEVVPTGATVVVNSPIYTNTQATITVESVDNLTLAGGLNGNLVEIFGGGTLHLASSSINILKFYHGTVQLTSPTSVLTAGFVDFVTSPASLDVNRGAAIITGTSLSALTADVKAGYNLAGGGQWNGVNAITSAAAAADTTHLTAVGVIGNNQSGSPLYSATHQFHGDTPGTNDTLVAYTYFGDANLSGKVDGSDYSLIDAGYASHGSKTGWYYGDFNYDGVIDGSDYTLIDNAFNNQGTPINPTALVASDTAQVAAAPAAVPEPAAAAAIAVLALVARHRRRHH